MDRRTSQGAYLAIGHLTRTDPLVHAFERHVRDHLGDPFELATVAAALGTTTRTLQRHVRTVVGATPIEVVQRLRVERATHLLWTTDHGLERIASLVGYANASTLRTLLRRQRPVEGRSGPTR